MMLVSDAPPELYARMRRELTLPNPRYKPGDQRSLGMSPTIDLWRDTPDGLLVPRHYWSSDFAPYGRRRREPVDAGDFEHKVLWTPRPDQLPTIAALQALHPQQDVGIRMPCGSGKTFVSLNEAARQRGRILVTAPMANKLNEWHGAVQSIMGLDPSRIGRVQADKRDWRDKPVTLCMLKTLSMQDFEPEFLNGFGVVIWDEVHLAPPPFLGRALGRVSGKQIALSATPGSGVSLRILHLHLGSQWISSQVKRRPMRAVIVHLTVPSRYRDMTMDQLVNRLGNDPSYLNYAASVTRVLMDQGRRVLVLHRVIQPLLEVHRRLDLKGGFVVGADSILWLADQSTKVRSDLTRFIGPKSKAPDFYMADVKASANPILATGLTRTQPGGTGMDVENLDAGVIMLPVGGTDLVEQIKGRLDREHPGKQDPVMVVLAPKAKASTHVAAAMKRHLERLGVPVEERDA